MSEAHSQTIDVNIRNMSNINHDVDFVYNRQIIKHDVVCVIFNIIIDFEIVLIKTMKRVVALLRNMKFKIDNDTQQSNYLRFLRCYKRLSCNISSSRLSYKKTSKLIEID